jgi:hypothetical protein
MVMGRGGKLSVGLLAEIGSLAGDDGEVSYEAQVPMEADGD